MINCNEFAAHVADIANRSSISDNDLYNWESVQEIFQNLESSDLKTKLLQIQLLYYRLNVSFAAMAHKDVRTLYGEEGLINLNEHVYELHQQHESPERHNARKEYIENLGQIIPDDNHDEVRTNDSKIDIEEVVIEVPSEFKQLKAQVESRGFESWDKVSNAQPGLNVFIHKNENGTAVQVATIAKLPNISKDVAFRALNDIKARATWDEIKFGLKVIEEDEENQRSVFYHSIATPFSYTTRDAVVQSKGFKGVKIGSSDAYCII